MDFYSKRTSLINEVVSKVSNNRLSYVNDCFHSKYVVNPGDLGTLLESIEGKLRKCQILYLLYFDKLEHSILTGSVASLPFRTKAEFSYGTYVINQEFEINDRTVYQEMLDGNLQTFVLTAASILENLVLLKEILFRKVIIHTSKTMPQSTPMSMYRDFLNLLIALNYRSQDSLYNCLLKYDTFFETYLKTINELRNSYTHGYKTNTLVIAGIYTVRNLDTNRFSPTSPQLILNNFTKEIFDNLANFTDDLLDCLVSEVQVATSPIPL